MTDASIATWSSAASVWSAAISRPRTRTTSRPKVAATSISPDAMRAPRLAGGRSSATASPVTRSSAVSVANSGVAIALSLGGHSAPRVCAWTSTRTSLAHVAEWRRLEELLAPRTAVGSGVGRAGRALPAGRDPPLRRPHVGAGRHPRRLPVVAALPGAQPRGRHPHQHLARRPAVLRRAVPGGALPAALVVAGHAWPPTSSSPRVMIAVAARPPRRRAEPALARPRSTSWSTTTSRTTTASTPPATSPPRSGSTTPGSPRSASRSACSGFPVDLAALQEHRQPRDHRLDHDPPRPRRRTSGG